MLTLRQLPIPRPFQCFLVLPLPPSLNLAPLQAQDNKILNNALHGPDAMNFFILAHRQFYLGSTF